MVLWVCTACTTAYAVGVQACPHCRSTGYVEEGQPVPKNTVHGGPSNAAVDPPPEVEAPAPPVEVVDPVAVEDPPVAAPDVEPSGPPVPAQKRTTRKNDPEA